MRERDRMLSGKLYHPGKIEGNTWDVIRAACKKFNDSEFWHDDSALNELCALFAQGPEDMTLTPPFYCDHGDLISFGRHFYANTGLTILDEAKVTFGDNVYVAPHVSIYTAAHPIDRRIRATDLEYAKPVTIGNDVWIGGNVVINPGVSVGDDVVIASGAVVTHDIPPHVIAGGCPCRVLRPITQEDRDNWQSQYEDYTSDPDTEGLS